MHEVLINKPPSTPKPILGRGKNLARRNKYQWESYQQGSIMYLKTILYLTTKCGTIMVNVLEIMTERIILFTFLKIYLPADSLRGFFKTLLRS